MPILPVAPELPGAEVKAFGAAVPEGANLPQPLEFGVARSFPYSMVGSLVFRSGFSAFFGSATLIEPKVALTAGHNLYDGSSGFSTNVRFTRGLYGGGALRSSVANRITVYSSLYIDEADRNPNTSRAFSNDIGWVTFRNAQAGAQSAPYTAKYSALRNGAFKTAVGYGLDFHNGRLPLAADPTAGFFRIIGAYFENRTYGTEGGMSGGPVFTTIRNQLVQTGVVVSGYANYQRSGIRAISRGVVRRLQTVE